MISELILRKMMGNKKKSIALLTLAIITIQACNSHKSVDKELTAGQIESLFKLCPDDTLVCIGSKEGSYDFIYSDPFKSEGANTDIGVTLSNYMRAASMLGIDYEKGDMTISSINSLKSDVAQKIHDLYLTSRQDIFSNIAVPYSFSPKVKLTNQINDTSLESIIRQSKTYRDIYALVKQSSEIYSGLGTTKTNISKEEQIILNKRDEALTKLQYVDRVSFAYFPDNKNLCKVYFLSCPEEFCRNNSLYVENLIKRDISANELSSQNKEKENIESWKDYL